MYESVSYTHLTVTRSLDLIRSAGVDAHCQRQDDGDSILLTIRLPKQKQC